MTQGLVVNRIYKTFGGLTAISEVSFKAVPGTITGIIGVNGAGKSTLLNCLCGLHSIDSGEILLDARPIQSMAPDRITRLGVGRTFQIPRLFHSLTLRENIAIGETGRTRTHDIDQLLRQVDLYRLRDNTANELSGGQKKLIELLRIQYHDARLILLDEPFAGVHPDLIRVFLDLVKGFRAAGKCVLLVSHDLTSIYASSDNIIALNQGEIIAQGSAQTIQRSTSVLQAYLGE